MTTFSRATITIATIYGPQEVQAMVRGGLAVHGSTGLYTVTHVASGKAICHSDQQRTAKGVALELLDSKIDWLDKSPDVVETRAIIDRVSTTPKYLPVKPIVAPPLELEPIYPSYFTPSERLRAMDIQIADGDFGLVSEASNLEQRELIMVRMGTGKQAVLLDKDIPPQPRTTPLPAHIPPGYAGVKLLTQQMWKLGQAIDKQAENMVRLFGETFRASEDDKLYDMPLAAWMTMDDNLSEMIKRGWCDWAICVTLFATLTKAEQQKITDVLGFVGSEEQGWVAYGKKTFLRSKRLVELTECRRAVAAALNG